MPLQKAAAEGGGQRGGAALRTPLPRWATPLLGLSFCVAGLVALVLVFAGPATYEDIAVRESLHRQVFFAPAKEDPRDGVEGTTYPTGTLVQLHRDTLAYVLGEAPALPRSPTRGAFYSSSEASHMADVRSVFAGARVAAIVALVVAAILLAVAALRGPAVIARTVRDAAVIAVILVAVVGAAAALAFEPAFLLFHEVFFPQGNFSFDPASSNMLKLYPEEYWYAVTVRVGLGFLLVAAVVAAAAQVASRRLAR